MADASCPLMREFDLLQHVFAANAALDARIEVPPGDDMAVIRLGALQLLAAVDQLVDGRHVRLETTPIELVGRKALARSLSDIAAMAAEPVASLVAATLPPNFTSRRADALFDAMRETAAHYNCPLIGGDLAFHRDPAHPLTCSVTVLAQAAGHPPVTRSGAQVGDGVYVTGRLGGSYDSSGGGRHLTFQPRIAEALELAAIMGDRLHAMIDISDGLGRDASHLATMSRVRITLAAEQIPCSDGLTWRRAMADGEDYELCFTCSGNVPEQIGTVPVTLIGQVVTLPADGSPAVIVQDGDAQLNADELGWQHES